MNRLVFIIPFRNVSKFIESCYTSLLVQENSNWISIFCDDASTDGSIHLIPESKKFIKRINTTRLTALPNIHFGITESGLQDEDIVCLLDGDDFLIRKDVVDIVSSLYDDGKTLLTYGQYIWPNGQIGHCKPYTKKEFENLRNGGYWASHMRTFKYKLYKELMKQDPDLGCYRDDNGEFYTMTYDVAMMTPLMEIAGFERIKFNPEPLYYYRVHEQNDHYLDPNYQKVAADHIFRKKPFNMILET